MCQLPICHFRLAFQVACQLWDTGARAPFSTCHNFILVHFGVNLRANYVSTVQSVRLAGADVNNSQLFRSVLH